MLQMFSPSLPETLLTLRRQSKPKKGVVRRMCDNCLYGHERSCEAPERCSCICQRSYDLDAKAAA